MVVAKAKPGVAGARDYIGNADGAAPAPRAGMDAWIKCAIKYSNKSLWNNGSWGQRDMKGKPGSLSVHATGRAVDLSYRYFADTKKGVPTGRKTSLEFINKVVANANALGVQAILDYFPKPFGRGWRCDRQAWSSYSKPDISGAPGGDWWHVEITPAMADNPQAVEAAFLLVFGDNPPTV
jgi:hypothetical protein